MIRKQEYNITAEHYRDLSKEELKSLGSEIAEKELSLHIGDYVSRINDAGESHNKIIGFLPCWNDCSDEVTLRIICDRAKRYLPSYYQSKEANKMVSYHGEIWDSREFLNWKKRDELLFGKMAEILFQGNFDIKHAKTLCFVDDL